jgi:hypothetical protein
MGCSGYDKSRWRQYAATICLAIYKYLYANLTCKLLPFSAGTG